MNFELDHHWAEEEEYINSFSIKMRLLSINFNDDEIHCVYGCVHIESLAMEQLMGL